MIEKIADDLIGQMTEARLIDKDMEERYIYVFICWIEKFITVGSIIVISLAFHKLFPTIFFLVFFLELRKRTGGYHLDKFYKCYLASIVVSNDSANRHSTVFHAVPLTSKIHKKTYLPTHIFISSFKAVGLRTNSIAQCEQLCDVKDTDLIEKIGKVSKNQLRQITKGMQIQLGMSTKHNNPIA